MQTNPCIWYLQKAKSFHVTFLRYQLLRGMKLMMSAHVTMSSDDPVILCKIILYLYKCNGWLLKETEDLYFLSSVKFILCLKDKWGTVKNLENPRESFCCRGAFFILSAYKEVLPAEYTVHYLVRNKMQNLSFQTIPLHFIPKERV